MLKLKNRLWHRHFVMQMNLCFWFALIFFDKQISFEAVEYVKKWIVCFYAKMGKLSGTCWEVTIIAVAEARSSVTCIRVFTRMCSERTVTANTRKVDSRKGLRRRRPPYLSGSGSSNSMIAIFDWFLVVSSTSLPARHFSLRLAGIGELIP